LRAITHRRSAMHRRPVSRSIATLFVLGALSAAAGRAVAQSALPADWEKNSPVFRGPTGSGIFTAKNVPVEWNEKENKNILWKAALPLGGLSSPVVWGDRIFVSGASKEKREVYCLNAKDGKIAWTGTYETSPDASTDYKVYEQLEALMYAAPTPAVDGKRVYAIFANGELVAFDAATGKAAWSKVAGKTDGNQYGYANSLLAYKEGVIVHFVGDDNFVARYEGATGKEVWRTKDATSGWSSPILIQAPDKKYVVVAAGAPEIAGYDAETGKKLWAHEVLNGDVAPSPIYAGGLVFMNFKDSGIFGIDPAGGKEPKWTVTELQNGTLSDSQSMAADGKLVYQFYQDVLSCLDAGDGKVVYEQTIDGSASYASPMVVGDKLYLFCGNTAFVVQTGREFKLLGKCRIEEHTDVSPAVVDNRIYLRTEKSLYCVGAF
jgi:outer membrane protein assembly factor BamB